MLLSNYYVSVLLGEGLLISASSRSFDSASYALSNKIKNTSGGEVTSFNSNNLLWGAYRYGSGVGVIVGSGTRAVTISDFALAAPISTSDYSVVKSTPRIVYDGSTGQFYIDSTMTVTCTSSAGITINEWGIVTSNNSLLIYREVFDTTYNLSQGDSIKLTVRVAINTPFIE